LEASLISVIRFVVARGFSPASGRGSEIALIRSMDQRQAFGRRGEDLACEELEKRGYVIVERRFRTRCGELDIVARDGGVLAFVEVRARSGCHFGTPFESVTWQKRQRLCKMAVSYLTAKRLWREPCRFDVVSVLEGQGARTIELVKGAFDMPSLQR
jgi:putative endonuclease